MRARRIYQALAFSLVATVLMSGCTPRLTPLYRDYRITKTDSSQREIHSRIISALEEAGWNVTEGVTPNIVATESKKFGSYFIYTMEVELEVSPVGKDHVRVLIHPYRKYFTGSRGKVPYLQTGMAQSIMATLQEPFASYGLEYAGTAQSRDKAYRKRLD